MNLFGQMDSTAKPKRARAPKKPAVVYRPATEHEARQASALAQVCFFPGTNAKRFARELHAQIEHTGNITDPQARYLNQLAWKFRRQMPRALVPTTKPESNKP